MATQEISPEKMRRFLRTFLYDVLRWTPASQITEEGKNAICQGLKLLGKPEISLNEYWDIHTSCLSAGMNTFPQPKE